MTSPFKVAASLIGTATLSIGKQSVATRAKRKFEPSQRSVDAELRIGLGLALCQLERSEGFRGAYECHRQLCQTAFKSFKLAYSGVKLANARAQAARRCERPDFEQVARAV
jgi:hypothetical protein